MGSRKRLGDLLQEKGLLTEEELNAALKLQRESGEKLGDALVKLGLIQPEQMADVLSEHLGIPRVDPNRCYIPSELVNMVPDDLLNRNQILPIELENNLMTVAMTDPLNILIIDELQQATGFNIKPVIATSEEIMTALGRTMDIASSARAVFDEYLDDSLDFDADDDNEEQLLGDAPGVRLANLILQQAVRDKASDIHLEPTEDDLQVRFRIDGILRNVMTVPKRLRNDVNSRIKIMSNLDITERRRPQDGRIQAVIDGVEVDMRISTLPTIHGEKIVARVLNKSTGILSIEQFGFSQQNTEEILRVLRLNQGLILVTGPTGSGKTTTLYGFLQHLNTVEKNIITVEDPVEYQLPGINQVQINHKVGLTFASGLRSVLRQDPDIIMVGEIRDQETAEIAIRSALTGHLVLSTLHTNNTVATIARLLDMDIDPYLISSTLVAVISQRLVRKICNDCKEQVELTDPLLIRFIKSYGIEPPEFVYQGRGCPACQDSGYRGRVAVEEMLILNKELKQVIDNRAHESLLRDIALKSGMVLLQVSAIKKLIAGITTGSEILRTVYSIDGEEALF
ncbi:MAG: Flp pilus assembly complex ATPase component TadA [Firmicutes bacterium]|nr:Flp pilus assembly complex ATPase component TadA [Bacillota bacterium]